MASNLLIFAHIKKRLASGGGGPRSSLVVYFLPANTTCPASAAAAPSATKSKDGGASPQLWRATAITAPKFEEFSKASLVEEDLIILARFERKV